MKISRRFIPVCAFWLAAAVSAGPLPVAYFYSHTEASDPTNVRVTVEVRPRAEDLGATRNLYVFAILDRKPQILTSAGWEKITSRQEIPAFKTQALRERQSLEVLSEFDGVASAGTALFVGYGESFQAMIDQETYDLVYTASVAGADDPLVDEQWFLQNFGQNAFAGEGGVPGEDLRVGPVHQAGILGQDVVLAIVDDGMEIAHPDLRENVIPGASVNTIDGSDDTSAPSGSHGTSVAGIAASRGWNNIGGRGVAPEARLKAYNLLAEESQRPGGASVASQLRALGARPADAQPIEAPPDAPEAPTEATPENSQALVEGLLDFGQDVWVFNQSFGITMVGVVPGNTIEHRIRRYGVTALRAGLGAVFVKSAGNDFKDLMPELMRRQENVCQAANAAGVGCGSAQAWDNTWMENLVVGALNADGVRSSYSSVGANLLVSAPGGESGIAHPAMVTTDLSGCERGIVKPSMRPLVPPFNTGHDYQNNPRCDYNSRMNGTSSAAPSTSGVVALMLAANRALSWRDVRHILVNSARQVDPDQPGVTIDVPGSGSFQAEYPWITNAAGLHFHNWYGFGAVDAQAAVAMAESWTQSLPPLRDAAAESPEQLGLRIPDAKVAGLAQTLELDQGLSAEFVRIRLDVEHPRPSDLAVELISPSGTRSLLLTPFASLMHPNMNGALASNAFYGESCAGTWTLRLTDVRRNQVGTFNDWSILCRGH
jgi:subtilisin family serine protease